MFYSNICEPAMFDFEPLRTARDQPQVFVH